METRPISIQGDDIPSISPQRVLETVVVILHGKFLSGEQILCDKITGYQT